MGKPRSKEKTEPLPRTRATFNKIPYAKLELPRFNNIKYLLSKVHVSYTETANPWPMGYVLRYLNKKLMRCLPILAVPAIISGCSTIMDARGQKEPFMSKYYSGNFKEAAEQLVAKSEARSGTGDELMWRLDEGSACFTAGLYEKSLEAFERSEQLIAEYDERAVISARDGGSEAGSAITNPNALPYKGMYLDRVMLNAYKALVYFALGNPSAAQVELRRMRDSQKLVQRLFDEELRRSEKEISEQNRKNQESGRKLGGQSTAMSFNSIVQNPTVKEAYESSGQAADKLYGNLSNPFVTYLSAIGYLLENNPGEATVDFRNLYRMMPQNKLVQRDYATLSKMIGAPLPDELQKIEPHKHPMQAEVVYVIMFNGRAPALKQEKFQIILPYVGYTGVAFPRYEYFPPQLGGFQVSFKHKGETLKERGWMVSNFDAIMSQEYHNQLPSMITRIVISTLTKEIASYAAVRAAKEAGTGAEIGAYALTGLYKYLFNTADTRCWEALPRDVHVLHFPIPEDRQFVVSALPPGPYSASGAPPEGNVIREIASFKLKNDSRFAIVFVRALSPDRHTAKLFEIQ